MIYLDSASTTPLSNEVLNEMMPYLTGEYGNPNSIHELGIKSRKAIEEARERVAEIINANPRQIVFTSGGSEGNNTIIHGIKKVFPDITYVSSKMEHTSTINALDAEFDTPKRVWFLDEPELKKGNTLVGIYRIDTSPIFIWRMFVNNEVGQVNNVYNIGKEFNGHDNLFFGSDCVQALGFEKIDVNEMQCDFLTISSHKIHGPKGIGALYVRDKSLIEPLINGGVNQEFGMRGGTENVAGIVGFGKACELAGKNREENKSRILYLRNLFLEELDGVDYKVNCSDPSKILSLQFPGINAETLVLMLSANGIAVSAGSACRNREDEVNKALIAFGLTEIEARSTIRISLMESLGENDIIKSTGKLKSILEDFETNGY